MRCQNISACWRARDSCGGDGQGGNTCCPSIRNHSMKPRRGLRDKERGGPRGWIPWKPSCWPRTGRPRKNDEKERIIPMSAEPKKQDDRQGQQPSEYGVVTEPGTVRLERVLPGPMDRVWAYLTEPEKRGKWLASGAMELRVGGLVELKFNHSGLSAEKSPPDEYKKYESCTFRNGRVTRCEPPKLLSYTWGDEPGENSEVTFELSSRGK